MRQWKQWKQWATGKYDGLCMGTLILRTWKLFSSTVYTSRPIRVCMKHALHDALPGRTFNFCPAHIYVNNITIGTSSKARGWSIYSYTWPGQARLWWCVIETNFWRPRPRPRPRPEVPRPRPMLPLSYGYKLTRIPTFIIHYVIHSALSSLLWWRHAANRDFWKLSTLIQEAFRNTNIVNVNCGLGLDLGSLVMRPSRPRPIKTKQSETKTETETKQSETETMIFRSRDGLETTALDLAGSRKSRWRLKTSASRLKAIII